MSPPECDSAPPSSRLPPGPRDGGRAGSRRRRLRLPRCLHATSDPFVQNERLLVTVFRVLPTASRPRPSLAFSSNPDAGPPLKGARAGSPVRLASVNTFPFHIRALKCVRCAAGEDATPDPSCPFRPRPRPALLVRGHVPPSRHTSRRCRPEPHSRRRLWFAQEDPEPARSSGVRVRVTQAGLSPPPAGPCPLGAPVFMVSGTRRPHFTSA